MPLYHIPGVDYLFPSIDMARFWVYTSSKLGERQIWVPVEVYAEGELEKPLTVTLIGVPPKLPDCVEDEDHMWRRPHEIVGGLEDNPGVFGHKGGQVIHSICVLCGKQRVVNTWAQDPLTGIEGLEEIIYEEPTEEILDWLEENQDQYLEGDHTVEEGGEVFAQTQEEDEGEGLSDEE